VSTVQKQFRAWLLLGWIALTGVHADLGPPVAESVVAPQTIVLTQTTPPLSLDRRSQYWVDKSGQATVRQVEAAGDTLPWALRKHNAQYPIDGQALWFRFDVQAAGGRWFLELGSSGLDRVQLFRHADSGGWVEQEAGDSRPVSEWPLPGRLPTFELASGNRPVRYLLRVEHARVNFASPITLFEQADLLVSREREQFLLGAFFGLAALIAFVSFATAAVNRDRHFGIYAVYVVVLAMGQVAYLGVGAQYLWNDWLRWNEMSTFVLPSLTTAAALWFARTVTEPARFSRRLDLAVWGVILAVLGAVAVDAVVESRASLAAVMGFALAGMVIAVVLIGLVWAEGDDPHIRLLALGFLPIILMAIFPVARGLNLVPATVLSRYGLAIGAALEMPILFYALSLRGTRRREAEVRAAALARTDALTGLAHLRSLQQRLEGALARCHSQKHACSLLVIRLLNYAAIADEHGRETAERALVITASILRSAISDIDLAARIEGHEFALLLEGPTTPVLAGACAQLVVARGLQQSGALPPTVTLRYSVAVAMLPDKEIDADGSLSWLREACRAIRAESRRAIRTLNF
jgi:diguanylate cyclase (GGDEF)-like protein